MGSLLNLHKVGAYYCGPEVIRCEAAVGARVNAYRLHLLLKFADGGCFWKIEDPDFIPVALGNVVRNRRAVINAEGETAEYFGYMRDAASRMQLLVRDLLTYTKMNRIELPLQEADAGNSLSAAVANLQQSIADNDATVTFDEMPSLRVHTTHM